MRQSEATSPAKKTSKLNLCPSSALCPNTTKLGSLLMFVQLLDLFFTLIGIYILGIESEGNHIMHKVMVRFDPVTVLITTKSLAIIFVFFLIFQADRLRFIKPFFVLALVVYLFGAILPWASIIGHYLAQNSRF